MNNRGTLEEPRTCLRALVTNTRSRVGLFIIASPLGSERERRKEKGVKWWEIIIVRRNEGRRVKASRPRSSAKINKDRGRGRREEEKKAEPREDFWHVACDALADAGIAINGSFGNITRIAGYCPARFRMWRDD